MMPHGDIIIFTYDLIGIEYTHVHSILDGIRTHITE